MDVVAKFLGCIFICLAIISSSIYAEDTCVPKSPCVCEFSNGTGIDLSDSAKSSTFYTTQYYDIKSNGSQYELSTYYYHPCIDILPLLNATKINNTCTVPLSMCRHVSTMTQINTTSTYKIDTGSYDYMGSSNFTKFSADGRSIVYYNGPSQTLVLLVCAETEGNLHIYSMEDPQKIVLQFYSKSACLKFVEEPGRSVGSTLCIIFFSFVIFYLVLGVCTKKFLMGATGVEVVPNLGFWTDLPNLVKDGWAYTASGFKLPVRSAAGPATSPDPNSYDSI